MDRQKDNMVLKGMSSVHSGLGILLGVGRISANTHEQIIALLNDNNDESSASERAKNIITKPKNLNCRTPCQRDPPLSRSDPDSAVSLIDLQHGLR
ncbi:hypothetical protein PG994_002554 [Apiospora phragmitis]|uniref:Uncharacterized protein n=1 Tax=Apiospora phragmitis TaxID=2905665 RepID=A0ABR1W5N8_9PEZI